MFPSMKKIVYLKYCVERNNVTLIFDELGSFRTCHRTVSQRLFDIIFSVKPKTKEKTAKYDCKNIYTDTKLISKQRYDNDLICVFAC